MMRLAPPVKPCRIPFRHKIGSLAAMEAVDDRLYLLRRVIAIDSRKERGCRAFRNIFSRITGVQQTVEAGVYKHLSVDLEIFAVGAVRPVFVFDLNHEDIATISDEEGREFLPHPGNITLILFKVLRL